MRKYIISILFFIICSNSWAQVHKIIWGDERYMICYDKTIEIHCHAKSDLTDGKWIFYYDSAMTKYGIITYSKNKKRENISFFYRKNGSLAQINTWKNNRLNGENRDYHENGQLKAKSYYFNHISIGEYTIYDTIGNIISHDIYPIPTGALYRKPFIPDTTINKDFILNNSVSFQDILSAWQKTHPGLLEKDTGFLFCNKSKSQYLIVYLNERDKNKEFSCFEIGYTKARSSQEKCLQSDYFDFTTESEIKLGMTREKLLAIKGTDYYIMTEDFVRYSIDDSGKVMTNQKNTPEYILECEFNNDKISKIRMGLCPDK